MKSDPACVNQYQFILIWGNCEVRQRRPTGLPIMRLPKSDGPRRDRGAIACRPDCVGRSQRCRGLGGGRMSDMDAQQTDGEKHTKKELRTRSRESGFPALDEETQ